MRLRVSFEKPGFFLNAPRLLVRLDGRTLFDGSFKEGFDVSLDVQPGRPVIETFIGPRPDFARTQRIELALTTEGGYRDVPAVEARLRYSRLSGNFERKASLSTRV